MLMNREQLGADLTQLPTESSVLYGVKATNGTIQCDFANFERPSAHHDYASHTASWAKRDDWRVTIEHAVLIRQSLPPAQTYRQSRVV